MVSGLDDAILSGFVLATAHFLISGSAVGAMEGGVSIWMPLSGLLLTVVGVLFLVIAIRKQVNRE